jgi:hypothetical protein
MLACGQVAGEPLKCLKAGRIGAIAKNGSALLADVAQLSIFNKARGGRAPPKGKGGARF